MMHREGFSLVELSIVLVILGLLTGGVLTAQNLIRAAELRSVTTEFQKYQTAVHTFRDRYFALPGDMRNATDFWGAATCPTTAGTGTETCNGDGDGRIENPAAAAQFGESYSFWQHLANAGLINGDYSGMAGSGGINHHILGGNAPQSRMSNVGWKAGWWNTSGTNSTVYAPLDYNNFLRIGGVMTNTEPGTPAFSPEEAWNIDTKIDDGRPAYGDVIASHWDNLCTDATASDDYDSNYRLSDSTRQCTIYFRNAF